jgi:NTE family protein
MQRTPSFWEGVSIDAVEAALAGLARQRFEAGAVILAEGDYRGEMYVLRAGTADVVLVDRKGVENVVSSIHPGETIGEMSLLTGSPASATVRAAEDVELVVLQKSHLEALTEQLPELQRNLIGMLSARLARVTRLALHEQPGRLIVVEDGGGPDLLGFALAASMAWHTRGPTLHVVLGARPSESLSSLVTLEAVPPFRGTRAGGAELMIADLDGYFGPDRIEATVDELRRVYDQVVLQLPRAWTRRPLSDRTVRLGFFDSPDGGFAVEARVLRIPELTSEDRVSLEQGLLPARGAAGTAVGGLARELANLRVGIAFGAGSLRGYAHLGALRALERHNVPVDCVAGTSIGAIVAGLYARFGDVDLVTEGLDGIGQRMFRPTLSRKSLLSTRAMRRYMRRVFGDQALEDLPIPVGMVATDVDTMDEVVLRRGNGVSAMAASSAVPGVFPAVRIGNRTLVDGGMVNPVPASVAATLGADVVIGIRLVHGGWVQADELSEEGEGPVPSAVAAIMRSIELVQTRIVTESDAVPLILVTPEFGSIPAGKLRHFREGRPYIAAGEVAIDAALPRLAAALPWLRPIDAPARERALPAPATTLG